MKLSAKERAAREGVRKAAAMDVQNEFVVMADVDAMVTRLLKNIRRLKTELRKCQSPT